ncbi:R3H and coiled-coil domain-containing protein 1 [Chanos chanos]|uniref:R3H and coiled-coil domain-containing protein 1 n=1 Tax=Chanos chanos TaxID=29144 RepID=A0A6J2UV68_CHACN|nr:R3H and coiled-coil domain-containing protein 1-like [Chanos chanos]
MLTLYFGLSVAVFPAGTLAAPCFNGRYLPKQESEFVDAVLEELDGYLQRDDPKSVLLFPPFPSQLRFLIHKTTENHPGLCSFSVGESWSRRVVVCRSLLRSVSEEEGSDGGGSFYEQPKAQDRPEDNRRQTERAGPRVARGRGSRRPDKAIYVPRAMRQKAAEERSVPEQTAHPSSACSVNSSALEESLSDVMETSVAAECGTGTDSADTSLAEQDGSALFSGPDSGSCLPALDQTMSYFVAMSLEDQQKEDQQKEEQVQEKEEEQEEALNSNVVPVEPPTHQQSVDAMQDFTQEIISNLKERDIVIENTRNDYSAFENAWFNQDDFSHVIEIYNFPATFKTDDLLDAFSDYSDGGLKIKWVDDTHALGVFSSPSAALQALSIQHPLLKTRALSDASKKAKGKALRRAEFIQPVKERPRTDTAVARRMVTRALGLRGGPRRKHC